MKKVLVLFLILASISAKSQVNNFTGLFGFKKDARDLEVTLPSNNQPAVFYCLYTYGVNEQRIYQWFSGVPAGGSNGMNPDSLAINLAAKYIIVPTIQQQSGFVGYWSTSKVKTGVTNIPDFYTKLQSFLSTNGISSPSAKIDSIRAKNLIAAKVDKNNPITPGTNPLITYDAKGLVIGGSNLNSANVTGALGFTPEFPLTFVNATRAGNTVTIPALNSNMIVNGATIGLSRSILNSTYPNAVFGYMVFCPNITLGGAIYIKSNNLTGTQGTWQTISAPPTL